jgi:hypothetical protein
MVKGSETRRTKSHHAAAAVSGIAPPMVAPPAGDTTLVVPETVEDLSATDTSQTPGPAGAVTEPIPRVVGYIDGPDAKWRVVGWAQPLPPGPRRLDVHLLENDTELAVARAERFRGDLLEAGIGDGTYGFVLPLPARLFDGLRHKFSIHADGPAGPEPLGELDVALPSRPPAMLGGQDHATQKAMRLLQQALHRPDRPNNTDLRAYAAELTRTMKDIVNTYDYATALGLLYVHILRRRIDDGGLQSRLHRLAVDPDILSEIIWDVLTSDESRARHHGHQELGFPDLAPLLAWTGLRAQGCGVE